MSQRHADTRLRRSLGRRHGILLEPSIVPRSVADPAVVVHASVPREDDAAAGSAGGGVDIDAEGARTAAIAEALERYAASVAPVDSVAWDTVDADDRLGFESFTLHHEDQRTDPSLTGAGYDEHPALAQMWDLLDGSSRFIPAVLVGLRPDHGTLSTSSGLAASFSLEHALLRAVEELIERDAFMASWLHQLPGREVPFTAVAQDLDVLGGWMRAFDLTPAWSPHPVAAVIGMLPLEGQPRFSMGLACRSRWADAVTKAELECHQGIVFAGHEIRAHPEAVNFGPEDVTDFDRHAVYYTAHPRLGLELPILKSRPAPPPPDADDGSPGDTLATLLRALDRAGVRVLGRELTTIDLHQIGLRVVRVVAPRLTPIHHDHRHPFLGGTTPDRTWRYPDLAPLGPFPSPHPHPLG